MCFDWILDRVNGFKKPCGLRDPLSLLSTCVIIMYRSTNGLWHYGKVKHASVASALEEGEKASNILSDMT